MLLLLYLPLYRRNISNNLLLIVRSLPYYNTNSSVPIATTILLSIRGINIRAYCRGAGVLLLSTRRRFRRVRATTSINDGIVTSVLVTTSNNESTTTSNDELSLLIATTI